MSVEEVEESKSRGVKIVFGPVNRNNINSLKKLNNVCLPVNYSKKFYEAVLDTQEDLTKFAYVKGIPVGAICCRIEVDEKDASSRKLYIMTLVVLAAYRRQGIASRLLRSALEATVKKITPSVSSVYLHMQTTNTTAIKFYETFGFSIERTIENYYKRIDPPHCHVLSKTLETKEKTPPSSSS